MPIGTCIHTRPSAYTVGAIMSEDYDHHNLDTPTPRDLMGYDGAAALGDTVTPAEQHNVEDDH